ncbi:nuclease-related domain-containing protein [Cytobacillus dafuensis]|uniref:NERD domain-containing protein n=1 Tax=Cytobacillus dafuensis TaxID=1742359 RepID=A0A5B8Z7A7_CYTDA|nr:nuclease-related domain-containing protein [Cytobacillus dafuensis]QED48995.1 NERD domain-containing protein [Cytobacillus dafuensis]
MGQLIKIQDYVSRYEQNIYLYPSRYVRLKKQQWGKLKSAWENNDPSFFMDQYQANQDTTDWFIEEKQPFMNKLKGFLKLGKNEIDEEEMILEEPEKTEDEDEEEEVNFDFKTNFTYRPDSIEELKHQFLDQLFSFQMKWASSTLTEKSFVERKFYYDERLKYFLQRFPDTYLVLYFPLFLLKKAPVEVETIILGPTGVWCISFLESEDLAVFIGSKERFWVKRGKGEEKKVLNPLPALNRTGKIVQQIFQMNEIDLPIHKVVLSRNGYIDYPALPFDVQLIEKRNYEEWFNSMRNLSSPLKHNQIKGAQALLQFCQTTSIRRLEWELPNED